MSDRYLGAKRGNHNTRMIHLVHRTRPLAGVGEATSREPCRRDMDCLRVSGIFGTRVEEDGADCIREEHDHTRHLPVPLLAACQPYRIIKS